MDYPGKVITKTQVTPTQTSASGNWTLDDQAAAIKNNNWPVALVPNPISKSLRFNSADSAYLNRTPASASNRKTFTWSGWVKKSEADVSLASQLFSARTGSTATYTLFYFDGSPAANSIKFLDDGGANLVSSSIYRDPSAWYNIILAVDTTQATSSNRVKIYVNGTQLTAFSTATYPSQNADLNVNSTATHLIGQQASNQYFNGYLTEINFIDGQALTPSSFGMTNPQTGQWIPLKYSGTYGTNGFYLNFKDATSTTTLGYDYSGNANNWTTNNFSVTAGAGNDSLTDVPTPWFAYNTTGDVGGVVRGNYCTWNSTWANPTLTNGNLDYTTTAGSTSAIGTLGVSSGKWYFEVLTTTSACSIGVAPPELFNKEIGETSTSYGYTYNGTKYTNGSTSAYGNSYTANDIIGVALDLDNGKIWFSKNGTFQASGDPAAGTNAAFTGLSGTFTVGVSRMTPTQQSGSLNAGQRPFAYTPPTGFRSLCTTNLPATTIGFGLTNQGDDYFNAVLYTGNGTSQTISTVGFQPDFVWVKNRTTAQNHVLVDVIRGDNDGLFSNLTDAELTDSGFPALTSSGFSVGASSWTNQNGSAFVGWNWKAAQTLSKTYAVTVVTSGGFKYRFDGFAANAVTLELSEGGTFRFDQSDASNSGHPFRFSTTSDGTHGGGVAYTTGVTVVGTPGTSGAYTEITVAASAPTLFYYCTVHSGMGGQANTPTTNSFSNLTGTIQSNISPNTTAGFSVVTWTGTGSTGTVGHGLSSAPFFIIAKRRNASTNWQVYHKSLTASNQLCLNLNIAAFSTTTWNNTEPTSSVFSIDNVELGANGATMVAYCFAAVPGYSAFGSYTGNGSADGPFVFCGFEPRFILTKCTSTTSEWVMIDTARDTYNYATKYIYANASSAEASSFEILDVLSNGFKQRSAWSQNNTSGATYIYMAFAESPFQFANAR